jgi:hypothetical protein
MGKRSNFVRNKRDFYPTPFAPAAELVRSQLAPGCAFIEPCAGDGSLVDSLKMLGCPSLDAFDEAPKRADIGCRDALSLGPEDVPAGAQFITNLPWTRQLLLPLIDHLAALAPLWTLLPLDVAANLYFARYLTPGAYRLHKVQPVARVKWYADSKNTTKDNCAWFLFGQPRLMPPELYGRITRPRNRTPAVARNLATAPAAPAGPSAQETSHAEISGPTPC